MQELLFLCMTCCLNVLYKCMKFDQVIELTRNSIANDQSEITPKISKVELWFLCMKNNTSYDPSRGQGRVGGDIMVFCIY